MFCDCHTFFLRNENGWDILTKVKLTPRQKQHRDYLLTEHWKDLRRRAQIGIVAVFYACQLGGFILKKFKQ